MKFLNIQEEAALSMLKENRKNLKSQGSDMEYEVIHKGVDIYDPLTVEVYSDNGNRIAAWFIDTDCDKRAFCISQAFFADSSAWDKLKRALKASIDEDNSNSSPAPTPCLSKSTRKNA
ncbi:MAG: hypothetical protein Q7J76_08825 [Candidatus Brocadiaceae bacterium]|uniref:hypothetical protein n=1 Tax=Candidatus Wunengus sp. YC61 TaxID=3367698 RepID=UPI0027175A39|nr:hypothetical protein [Candidatus Brocadiaceae bacterium]